MSIRLAVIALALVAPGAHAESIVLDRGRIEACIDIEAIPARVACYDELARELVGGKENDQSRQPLDETALFGRGAAESSERLQQKLGVDKLEHLASAVARVRPDPYGKLMIELDNGQVWRQLDSARLPLAAGESVEIRRAGLGSFLLEKTSGSRTIRVRRVD